MVVECGGWARRLRIMIMWFCERGRGPTGPWTARRMAAAFGVAQRTRTEFEECAVCCRLICAEFLLEFLYVYVCSSSL